MLSASVAADADPFLSKIEAEIEKSALFSAQTYIDVMRPKNVMTRDSEALSQGLQVPPHLAIHVKALTCKSALVECGLLADAAERAARHLARRTPSSSGESRDSTIIIGVPTPMGTSDKEKSLQGNHIFIGHGRSRIWRDLKDFVVERLKLTPDEFNRVPVAGKTNIERLSQMLDNAAFAFLVLTAEDETLDGKTQARMNVIHEVGLFQGRLGFSRAIVMLEEGCEAFSNIEGLGQIRFPKGDIGAKFEEVRRVLEDRGILDSSRR